MVGHVLLQALTLGNKVQQPVLSTKWQKGKENFTQEAQSSVDTEGTPQPGPALSALVGKKLHRCMPPGEPLTWLHSFLQGTW